jgi:hypothetical protein
MKNINVRRNKKIEGVAASLTDLAEDDKQVGTPSMVLMPSRNYAFKLSKDVYVITIPRRGTYHELEPGFFSEEDGEFELYNEKKGIMYLPAISKVLFANKKYPKLEDHQLFAPLSLVFKKDVVEISGYVVDMIRNSESN